MPSIAQQLMKGKHKGIAQIKLHTAGIPNPIIQQSDIINPTPPTTRIIKPHTMARAPIANVAKNIKKQIGDIIGAIKTHATIDNPHPTTIPTIPPTIATPEIKAPTPPPNAQSPQQRVDIKKGIEQIKGIILLIKHSKSIILYFLILF